MKLKINKEEFVTKLLTPVSRFGTQAILHVSNGELYSIASQIDMSKQQVMMLATIDADVTVDEPIKLNIGDIKKFAAAVKCIDEDEVTLDVTDSAISYQSATINFRFHMLEDESMLMQKYTKARLSEYDGETKFNISNDDFRAFLRTTGSMGGVNKIYLSTRDGVVRCTQTDKLIPNTDSMETILSNTYTGDPLHEDVILCTDIFKIVASIKFESCEVAISSQGLVIITIATDTSSLKYYVAAQIQ